MNIIIPQNKRELFIKTSMWNSLIEVFKSEKNMDITSYLISIKLNNDILLVKTNKPILNYEFSIYDEKIREVFNWKINRLWINLDDIKIKYL